MWQTVKVGDVVKYEKTNGQGSNRSYLGMEHISSETMQLVGDLEVPEKTSTTFKFDARHVLFGRLRPYLRKVFIPDFEGQCSTEVFCLLPSEKVHKKFLAYWLLHPTISNRINDTSTGARMPRANMNAILDFDFLLPPLAEQQRIVAKLDAAFAEIDAAIAAADSAAAAAKAITKNNVNSFLTNPRYEWTEKKLSALCVNWDSKRIPITKSKRKEGDIPYYGASGIVDYVKDWIFDDEILLISEDGANLLMRTSPIAFSVTGKCWVNNHAHVLKFNSREMHKWVEVYINSTDISGYVSGMAQPKLNQKKLYEIPLPVPREEMLCRLNEKVNSIKELSEHFGSLRESKVEELHALKSALLAAELQGEAA